MTTLRSPSKFIVDKYRGKGFFVSQKEFLLTRPEICSLKSQKAVNFGFLKLISLQHKAVHPVTTLSSKTQADLEAGDTQIDEESDLEAYESKSVQVKFQIQKECMFGEQFLIVGDDPKLGLWDPSSAIPLDWSEGHVWTAELDVPIGKSIQFKFILKGNAGKILWQPGPDRFFKTWETKNTIIVCEDWENPEFQKVIEGEQLANQNEQPTVNSDILIVAENLTFPKDELVSYVNEGSANADSNTSTAENSIAEPHKEQIIADNIAPSQEKTKAMVADNISYSKEDPKVNAKDILDSNGRAPTLIEDNLNNYGGLVLVPGLTPLSIEPTEEAYQDESEKRIAVDVSVGASEVKDHSVQEASQDETEKRNAIDASIGTSEAKDHSLQEASQDETVKSNAVDALIGTYEAQGHNVSELDEKQEQHGDPPQLAPTKIFNGEEEQLDSNFKQNFHPSKIEEQHDSKPIDNEVLQNDIQWGRKTLQKLLINLGLL
ncbi:hypothetical protein SO802_031026 [Lithocarpus litseifolius]|uniref:CBM20 domain-containing protein n=1 Tax=Lithocarpus litseifolius TaxID=425828 RepID=A0AAW2BJB1_9ROSI